jgi:hypothetical protein
VPLRRAIAYDWWGSVGYPGRRFDTVAVAMMVGLAAFAREMVRIDLRRRGTAALALASVLLALAGAWNYGVLRELAAGVPTESPRPSPEKWAETLSHAAVPLWRLVGNPLAWPASIPFAIRYRVHPRKWDVVGSPGLFYHHHQTLRIQGQTVLSFTDPAQADYLAGTFAGETTRFEGNPLRYAGEGRARILLPLHWPEVGRMTFRVIVPVDVLPAGPDARVRMGLVVNGVSLGERSVAPGAILDLAYEMPHGVTRQGINEISLEIRDGVLGFVRLELEDVDPAPYIREEEKLLELKERRKRLLVD